VEKGYSMSRVCALTSRHKWGAPSEDAATVETKTADNIVTSRAKRKKQCHHLKIAKPGGKPGDAQEGI
jgi:hypothetical protein